MNAKHILNIVITLKHAYKEHAPNMIKLCVRLISALVIGMALIALINSLVVVLIHLLNVILNNRVHIGVVGSWIITQKFVLATPVDIWVLHLHNVLEHIL